MTRGETQRAPLGAGGQPAEQEDRPEELRARLRLAERKLRGIQAISVALGSDHHRTRVLETVMERTASLLDADRSSLFLYENGSGRLLSRYAMGEADEALELPPGRGIAGWVAQSGRTVNLKDAYQDPRFDARTDERTGFRTESVLCAPLLDPERRILGAIEVLNKREGYFTPEDEDLLKAIASQAAVKIHDSQLYLEAEDKNIDLMDAKLQLESRTRELELLFRIERAAATARDSDEAVQGVLDEVVDNVPCLAAAVHLAEPDTCALRPAALRGSEADRLRDPNVEPASTLIHRAQECGGPTRVHADGASASCAEPHAPDPDGLGSPPGTPAVAVPVAHEGETFGTLLLADRTDEASGFYERDARLLGVVGGRLGMAIALARAREEERRAERLATVGRALAGVLHDLKTPLTLIGGYAHMMVRADDRDHREKLRGDISRQIGQLQDMTRELLTYARGGGEVRIQEVALATFLDEIEELLRESFADSPVELVVEPTDVERLSLDPSGMKRVILNLARNALEAMPEGGRFRIAVERGDDEVVFRFADDGPGVPPEMQGCLFVPFATSGKKNGTGLGLPLAREIVERHGGRIEVDSVPGEGTTFRVRLPAEAA